ncbi:MAG: flagellar basal body P-ring formation chaperone FlgA [Planctomycetaceae bacterium]|jgi:flagella basal body P-ring formation protein FlgA|nr:flagellar basal body P-ring formation chaperone FlgA [Planctomycetaceae bacterium]
MKRLFGQIYFFGMFVFAVNFIFAAEIRFNTDSRVGDVLVRLGDVAEVISDSHSEVARLKQIILFHSPQPDEPRTITFTEIRDLLVRLGVNVFDHNFTGAKKITVSNAAANYNFANPNIAAANNYNHKIIHAALITQNANTNKPQTPPHTRSQTDLLLRNISPELIKQMEKLIAESIRIHLAQRLSATAQIQQPVFNVSLKLSREQTFALATNGQISEIDGGIEPFAGKQKFQIKLQQIDPKTNQSVIVLVEANLTPVTQCVVVVRNVPKGYIISESDVKIGEYENINFTGSTNKNSEYFINTNDVIGKETVVNLRGGDIVTQGKIKRPTWIRKGDVITIMSKNNGVIIRTVGIAKSDGSEGDTIFVTRINRTNETTTTTKRNRKQQPIEIVAMVSQPKVVEINATPISVR